MDLSKSIRLAMAENNTTNKELAEAIGVKTQHISAWRKSGGISYKNQIKIADFFGIKVSEFVALGE